MFLRFIEVFVVALTLIFFVTQIIWPILTRRKIFPLFRRQGRLEAELDQVEQEADEAHLASKIRNLRKRKRKHGPN